jgi:hypothetical protein
MPLGPCGIGNVSLTIPDGFVICQRVYDVGSRANRSLYEGAEMEPYSWVKVAVSELTNSTPVRYSKIVILANVGIGTTCRNVNPAIRGLRT